jgi:hypothetical protein
MGITLGWIALLLAGATGAPPAEKHAVPISYTVRMVEAEGVGWRSEVMSQLKPVTRQGASTVWTLPRGASKSLIQVISKAPSGVVVQAPRVMALSGVPATIQVRQNRKFVTQVAWDGDEAAPKGTPEDVRVGWHTTIVGRKLDQGILVKIVFEDTEIRGVHQVTLAGPSAAMMNSGAPASGLFQGEAKAAGKNPFVFDASPFETPSSEIAVTEKAVPGEGFSQLAPELHAAKSQKIAGLIDKAMTAYAEGVYVGRNASTLEELRTGVTRLILETHADCCDEKVHLPNSAQMNTETARSEGRLLELPEIANQEVLGEWLIPNGECLLVSFGPHTVADKNGKAVVRERLAFVEADAQTNVMAGSSAPFHYIPAPRSPIAPPAPFEAVAPPALPPPSYVPYSPNGQPLNGIAPPAPPAGFSPTPMSPFMPDGTQPPPGPQVPATTAPAARLPMPAAPSRSFPEGVHVDGSKAKLPPLPDDEMDDDADDSESAEPRPSPQTKKPRKPKPASDESTTRADFTKPKSSTIFLPSLFLPGSSVGFQFLLPISPLSFRLPFNQRLEIEIFGRVVPDNRTSDTAK